MNLFGFFNSTVRKEPSVVSESLFEKLQLFCGGKNDAITHTGNNSEVFPAATLCRGAGRLRALLHLRYILE